MLAHLQDIQVREGDTVRAGEFIARVGNNGYSRNPHVHVAAWKDDAAYQIRWDLRSRRIAGKGGDGSR
jgi:murein DD-endopeptidase MepM/ murein hydrolase activator NlpD